MRLADRDAWRFPPDRDLAARLRASPAVQRRIASTVAGSGPRTSRSAMLASAVMVDPAVLPHLARAIAGLRDQLPGIPDLELFVYNDADLNGFVTPGQSRTIVALSSATVNHLDAEELAYVLGHELGHAAYGHLDIPAGVLAADRTLPIGDAARVRSWQRAMEISADRTGLVACGSLSAAARALFKVASGIVATSVVASPQLFAAQWQRLADEVIAAGDRDFHHISHPFPPLRMRAMLLFQEAIDSGDPQRLGAADKAIAAMLGMMEPSDSGEPIADLRLRAFFFWGGLYLALEDGTVALSENRRLAEIAPDGTDVAAAVAAAHAQPETCLERFAEAFRGRRRRFSALEIHRIVYGLLDIARTDGRVSAGEIARLERLAEVMGVPPQGCALVAAQFAKERSDGA